jgi:hypothetical protein
MIGGTVEHMRNEAFSRRSAARDYYLLGCYEQEAIVRVFKSVYVLLAIVVLGSVLSAEDKRIAGRWAVSAEGYDLELVLEQNGRAIAGTLQTPHGPATVKGEFDGLWFEFSGATDGRPHTLEVIAKGILRADGTLAGVMTSNLGDFTWTATRKNTQ